MIARFCRAMAAVSVMLGVCAGEAYSICDERTAEDYFPVPLVPDSELRDTFLRSWYASQLRAMGERPLGCNSNGRTYRFTWLRTFHHPVTIRIEWNEGPPIFNAIEMDGKGGYEPGDIWRHTSRRIPLKTFLEIRAAFHELKRPPPPPPDLVHLDGAAWIFEGNDRGKYFAFRYHSPADGGARSLGERLIKLTRWTLSPVY